MLKIYRKEKPGKRLKMRLSSSHMSFQLCGQQALHTLAEIEAIIRDIRRTKDNIALTDRSIKRG